MEYKQVTHCRVCKSTNLKKYLDLGSVPLCNKLITQYSPVTKKYPIQVLFCEDCFLSQLSVVVNPALLYEDYVYHSSVSQTFKKHCYDLGLKLKEFKFNNSSNPALSEKLNQNKDFVSVLDIACNDGCLLREFRKAGYIVQGIDPAKNFAKNQIGEETGDVIPIYNGFFGENAFNGCTRSPFEFITAQNVFGHVDDLDDFLHGVNKWLRDDGGVFVIEVPYLINLIRGNQFDTIYHEHLSYYLLAPLMEIFNKHGLPIFRVEQIDIHGGSIRVYASKNAYPEEESVEEMLEYENMQGFYNFSTYISFGTKIDGIRTNLAHELTDLYNLNKKVMGYGASAKGISLMNYCGVQTPYVHSIVDDTPDKQGKMTPGSHVDIVSFGEFDKQKPDYILLLAWNFRQELIEKTKHLGAKYIVPIPDVRVV